MMSTLALSAGFASHRRHNFAVWVHLLIAAVMIVFVVTAMVTKSVLVVVIVALVGGTVAIGAGAIVREAQNSLEIQDSITLARGQGRDFRGPENVCLRLACAPRV
jgi:hypothetical protein